MLEMPVDTEKQLCVAEKMDLGSTLTLDSNMNSHTCSYKLLKPQFPHLFIGKHNSVSEDIDETYVFPR